MTKKCLLALLCVFALSAGAFAKDSDTRTWIDLFATKKINLATVGLIGEFYTKDDNHTIERTSLGLKGDYALRPWLSAGTGYVLMNFVRTGYHELVDRFYFQAEPSWHMSKFHFSFRERLQVTLYPDSRTSEANSYIWRNRLETTFKSGKAKVEPVIDLESLYTLNQEETNPWSEFRFTAGANYHMSEHQKFKFYGMYTNATHLDRYILGVVYFFSL